MAVRSGSAAEFVIATLCKYPDRELTVADIYDCGKGKFEKANLANSLERLAEQGVVVRGKDGHAVWWAIAEQGIKN
jgi:predicted MarR family transcription regulator